MRTLNRMLVLVAAVVLSGCAAGERSQGGLPVDRPGDFSVAVTVLTSEGPVSRPGQRAARYTVGPDASLRTALGEGATVRVHPGHARRLSPAERDLLWDAVRATGLDAVSEAFRVPSAETFGATSGRRVYLVEVTAEGQRRSVAMPEGEPETEPFIDLADLLAGWSWVEP